MSNLINKRAVRQLALDIANDMYGTIDLPDKAPSTDGRVWNYSRAKQSMTGRKYRQVSSKFMDYINEMVRVNVRDYLKNMPDKGSTIK